MENITSPAANKVLPKAGLNGFVETFVQGSTFVLRMNISAKNPATSPSCKMLSPNIYF
jgi:hypothetical protein